MSDRTRTTGTRTSKNINELEALTVDTTKGGTRHKTVTPFQVNEMLQNVFRDNDSGGLAFLDSPYSDANKIIFQPVDIERAGGDDSERHGRDSGISAFGNWSHWGSGNTEYKAEIPVNIYKETPTGRELQTLARGNGQYAISISGSTAMRQAFKVSLMGWELQCLNGMTGTFEFFKETHKQTKNLDIREMLIKGLNSASTVYNSLNNDVNHLQDTYPLEAQLDKFWISAVDTGTIPGGNLKEVRDYFFDRSNPWFRDKELNAYRLMQACTLYGERQKSADVKQRIQSRVYWPLSDAGLFDLPEGCKYPSTFQSYSDLLKQPEKDSGIVSDSNQIEISESEYIEVG